ncbi:hypothetical protein N0V92_007436 [Colletotrichum tropicale]|nr:hypothetical protein N0V92_007436 [Colletotrichum tropicale]
MQDDMNDIALQVEDIDALADTFFASDQAADVPSTLSLGIDHNLEASSSSSITNPNQSNSESSPNQLSPTVERLSWFLNSPSWTIAYHYHPPGSIPPAAVFTNFVRGLQDWLLRFLRKGHNPFIHRNLYTESSMPRCLQDAYAAIAIAQNVTPDNEHVVDATSATYILDLIASHSAAEPAFSLLTTRDHLARTQALLIHLLLSLFSPSISRRAKAESLIDTLRLWAQQLWESAALDATSSSVCSNTLSLPEDAGADTTDMVQNLYRAFVLSESIRRTYLLTSIATGVYGALKATWSETCGGDICITARAELWDAPSSARWEATARKADPLFLHSLHGQSLVERGIPAAEVEEFARLLFTVMWGLEKVERWVVSTGDSVSVMY